MYFKTIMFASNCDITLVGLSFPLVQDEKLRGARATESAIAAINSVVATVLDGGEGSKKTDATPEQLAQVCTVYVCVCMCDGQDYL